MKIEQGQSARLTQPERTARSARTEAPTADTSAAILPEAASGQLARHKDPLDIERRSFQIIHAEVGARAAAFAPEELPVVERVIHTTADFSFLDSLTFTPGAVQAGLDALRAGATIVTDTNMSLAGVSKPALKKLGCKACCFMADPEVAAMAKAAGTTRAVQSMDRAADIEGPLIVAVGNAPTALLRLRDLIEAGRIAPVLVIGVPVGFVNVVESKDAILSAGCPSIVARGRKGGSTVATAILNALLYQLTRPSGEVGTARLGGDEPEGPSDPGDSADNMSALAPIAPTARLAIFSGTSEGGDLCERLSAAGRAATLFVATDYGRETFAGMPGIEVHAGRLDEEAMAEALDNFDVAIDATHPYAIEATRTIHAACERTGTRYIRLARPSIPPFGDVVHVPSAQAAAELLAYEDGDVLLTTGSKELAVFANTPGLAPRLHIRCLPSASIVGRCRELGVDASHIIAMQGPFSHEMNVAQLHMARVRWLVTKDSGIAGGLAEKYSAAQEVGARVVLIDRPTEPVAGCPLGAVLCALGLSVARSMAR